MTTAALTHSGLNFTARITDMIERVKAARARAAEYQRTFSELQRLSNRELDDIGIRRCDIADIAHKHVYCS
ncbi:MULTISPECIES: DUF1127 domain-containing protein [unclassified Ruegeria]|uniref:DUF1127 domain-containing protein n=1 Tax=unclassified Ruegeria TaxID=2625375 RepID=UPI0014895461|nr:MULTISPECIES: DUF1127 domain-containing protein [unclassified Ruegeria]NOD75555.1 DUF1127 domain-containing protein [Ruegeria sp. HKCCD4332]NOD91046.1 DUF1127 domain-containing protein [Ruegeria sp. HKCCD4318]NOD95504.1 DUF1127 domain-containing protein [Ruegeria sp. HKCCD4884]NOE16424.1 DUF1127 domain-containing protein [Ruegeria sp. HKCCD4318-2]NOG10215.1 DUF1127 domain-containing protein [Ruegeria sp. HKCCD4315]